MITTVINFFSNNFDGVTYITYLLRWQCSTPLIALVLMLIPKQNKWIQAIIANLIGGLIFYWVDLVIFK